MVNLQIALEKTLTVKQGDIELIAEIARFESEHDMEKEYRNGWSWRLVRIWLATLNRLVDEGYIEMVFRSNVYTGFRLSELGRKIIETRSNVSYPNPQLE